MVKVLKSPIYVYEPITKNDINIRRCMIVLPNEYMLALVDSQGDFIPAVIDQIKQILKIYNGDKPKGIVLSEDVDKDPGSIFKRGDDVLMLCFVKEYFKSTQTTSLLFSKKNCGILDDKAFTNPLFKYGKVKFKLDVRVSVDPTKILFVCCGRKSHTEEEVMEHKKKITDLNLLKLLQDKERKQIEIEKKRMEIQKLEKEEMLRSGKIKVFNESDAEILEVEDIMEQINKASKEIINGESDTNVEEQKS